LPSSAFIRSTKRLLKKDRAALAAIEETLTILGNDAFDPRLATHKLKGDLAGRWACSAGYDLRIVFELVKHEEAESVVLVSCGSHDEVY
jgi:mRNA-degrading endonuclease YafQ of YafQ-DinJ toxin-antitoxin module